MTRFREYALKNTPVVSFDFDGTLHVDVDRYGNPLHYFDSDPTPNVEMLNALHKEAADGAEIVIVSARDNNGKKAIWDFVEKHGLPVSDVITTNRQPKKSFLKNLGAIRHYDDQASVCRDLEKSGIKCIRVSASLT